MDIESMTIDNSGYIDYLDGAYGIDNAQGTFNVASPGAHHSCGNDEIHVMVPIQTPQPCHVA